MAAALSLSLPSGTVVSEGRSRRWRDRRHLPVVIESMQLETQFAPQHEGDCVERPCTSKMVTACRTCDPGHLFAGKTMNCNGIVFFRLPTNPGAGISTNDVHNNPPACCLTQGTTSSRRDIR